MRHVAFAVAASSVAIVVVACSSSNDGSATPPSPDAGNLATATCPYVSPVAAAHAGAPGAAACAACLGAQCAPQLAAYAAPAGCADFIACACPGGVPAAGPVVETCQNDAVESACVEATTNVDVCEDTACSLDCNGTSVPIFDGGDGSAASTGTLLDASLSATCASYVTCCELALGDAGPPGAIQIDCEESASLLTDPQCEAYIVAYQDAGVACAPSSP